MKNGIALVCLVLSIHARAGWTDLNTGITDDLTGVVFWGNNGLVCGHNGLYYTTTGGVGPASWNQFVITTNPADSLVYSNTRFSHAYAFTTHTNYAFVCGEDTVNDRAVVFQFHIPTQAYLLLYQGATGTRLNNINYSTESDQYFAVGDDGLIVRFNLNTNGALESAGGGLDYESIFFYNDRPAVGANQYSVYGYDNNPGISLTTHATPGAYLKDHWRYGSTLGYAVGNSLYQVSFSTGNVTTYANYAYGPLNANSIYRKGSYYFIGTDHGIFRFNTTAAVEYQATSLQHFIYDFWNETSTAPLYACGKNGVLLSSLDNGGVPLPYMTVTEGGGCKGQSLTMSGTYGSASFCKWYLNGALVSSSCSNYSMIGSTTGAYEIKFKGTTAGGSDSAMTIFYVVDTPHINLPTVLNDLMLCKQEQVIIDIDQTQPDVYYKLVSVPGTTSFGNSPEGNGGIITYVTDYISQAGNYVLQATSSLANCSKKFTDTLSFWVEHTQADYHVATQNLVASETAQFFENCTDATNFSWEFPAGSGVLVSNLPDPTNTFSAPGNQPIKLTCWSDNGCYDSLVGPGPTVYVAPAVYDSCWVNLNSGDDPTWTGHGFPEISHLCPVSDGYLITGTFHDHAFATQYGDSLELDWFGSYLCKYDSNGVYKWNIHSIGAGNAYVSGPLGGGWVDKYSMNAAAEDADGNIYVCGYFKNWYVDNVGDTVYTPGSYGHILKLSSTGKTIWQMTTDELLPETVAVDNAGNIVVTSSRGTGYYGGFSLNLNGVPTDTISGPVLGNFGLTKFTSNGDLVWDIPVNHQHSNYVDLLRVGFDDQDNVYLTGTYEIKTIVYAVGGSDTVTNQTLSSYGQKIMLAKFTPAGSLNWLIRSYTLSGGGGDDTQPYDLSVDAQGNCYVSGSNNCRTAANHHHVESTDNSHMIQTGGQFFVMKVNTNGICEWVRAGHNSYYGGGMQNELVGDTLYVIGYVRQNSIPWTTVEFPNPDNTSIYLDISASDYFVATYDTSGYLYRIVKNGNNSYQLTTEEYTGFFKDNNRFFVSRSQHASTSNTYSYNDFGDTITYLNGIEGWVTKFCESCGVVYRPSLFSYSDTTICIGESFTFPGGNTVLNITAEVYDTLVVPATTYLDSVIITHVNVAGYPNLLSSDFVCYGDSYTFADGTTFSNITAGFTHTNNLTTVAGCDSIVNTILYLNPAIINTTVTVSGFSITSNHIQSMGTTYQWVDCANGYAPIIGQQGQTFTPDTDGSYAVMINENGCVDTSVCVSVYGTGLNEQGVQVAIYPNPTQDAVWISLDQTGHYLAVRMLDATGREILTEPLFDRIHKLSLPATKGIYYIQLVDENGNYTTHAVTKL